MPRLYSLASHMCRSSSWVVSFTWIRTYKTTTIVARCWHFASITLCFRLASLSAKVILRYSRHQTSRFEPFMRWRVQLGPPRSSTLYTEILPQGDRQCVNIEQAKTNTRCHDKAPLFVACAGKRRSNRVERFCLRPIVKYVPKPREGLL